MVENCCVFVLLREDEESSESGLLLLLMGKKSEKLRKEKIRALCEIFFLTLASWTSVLLNPSFLRVARLGAWFATTPTTFGINNIASVVSTCVLA
jgi:hypothetical protein